MELLHFLNRSLILVFDVIYKPLSVLGPLWSLVVISVLTGLVMLLIFGRISDQGNMKACKRRIQAQLIALRLFQDNLRDFFRIQGRLMVDTLIYLKLSAKPMLIMIVPVILILIQVGWRYSVRPFNVGEPILVKVNVDAPDVLDRTPIELVSPTDAIAVETDPIRIPTENEVAWRIRASQEGTHDITIRVGEEELVKTFVVGPTRELLAPVRTGRNALDVLLYPGELPIDKTSSIESMEVNYPERDLFLGSWKMNWLVLFFVVSIASGFLLKRFFGIEI